MNITGIKLILSAVIFISTFLCSTLPVCLLSWIKTRSKSLSNRAHSSWCSLNALINCITCFGGGIFLGACLLDLLPEVIYHTNMTIKSEFQYDNQTLKRYPVAEILIGCGIFLVLFIEQTILSFHLPSVRSVGHLSRKPLTVTSQEDDETALTNLNDQDPLVNNGSGNEHDFEISEPKEDLVTNKTRLLLTRNFILILSLIIHSIFEGAALGSNNEYKPLYELFFAIIIHKSIIAFSVGLKLLNMTNKKLIYCACFLISIATPVGILFVVSMQELLPQSRAARIAHEVFRAFACGTFFYITFFDVLPHELNMNLHQHHSTSNHSNRHRLIKVLCVFLGFCFTGLLSFMMK